MLTRIDIALLAILGLSAVVGIWRGLVSEVMALAVWIAAFWLALAAGPSVADMYATWVDSPMACWLLGYASVFLAALIVGGLLNWLLARLVKSTGLSGTDRLLGLGFGLARGAAIACLLVLLAGFTPMPQEAVWRDSQLLPGFARGAEWLGSWLPATLAEHLSFEPLQALLPASMPASLALPDAAGTLPAEPPPAAPEPPVQHP